MARQAMKKRSQRQVSGRSSSQKSEKYRFAQNVDGEETMAEREYREYVDADPEQVTADADVLLDVPVIKVDSIHLKLAELEAHVALKAEVFDLVKLNVGVDVQLGKVELDIQGVEAQALVKVRLDHVAAVVDRVMTTIDRNPDLLESIGEALEDVGAGAGNALGESGEAVDEVGQGAGGALQQVGQGAGEAVGQIGEGAGDAVGQVGQAGGQAVGDLGEGAGQAVGGLGGAAGGLTGQLGQITGGGSPGGEPSGEGQGEGAGEPGGESGQDGGAGGAPQGDVPLSGGQVAKVAVKTVAQEIGSAASDEAKDLGAAATRKVKELGEKRRERRARKSNATPAAAKTAEELDVDLSDVEGSGSEGRITVRDVREARETS